MDEGTVAPGDGGVAEGQRRQMILTDAFVGEIGDAIGRSLSTGLAEDLELGEITSASLNALLTIYVRQGAHVISQETGEAREQNRASLLAALLSAANALTEHEKPLIALR